MFRRHLRRVVASFVLCLSMFAVGVETAHATHFLGGTLSWERDFTFVSATHYRYKVYFQGNWRRSFPWQLGANPNVGQVFDNSYALVVSSANNSFQFTYALQQTAVAVNAAEDWLIGQHVGTVDIPVTAQFPIRLDFTGGDRLSTLAEGNRDSTWRLTTLIPNAQLGRSPQSTMLPRVYLQAGQAVQLPIPTTLASGAAFNTVEFAPTTDSALRMPRPMGHPICETTGATPISQCLQCANTNLGFCSAGMTVSNGVINWAPLVDGLYAVQFKVTSRDSANNVIASTPVDMIFQVLENCPTCAPPVIAPLPTPVTLYPGQSLNLPVTVTDANPSQTISIATTPLPAGATFAVLSNPAVSPVNAVLAWTPTVAAIGSHQVCFQATDSAGFANLGSACTTINVVENQAPMLQCFAAQTVTATSPAGAPMSIPARVYDVEGDAVNMVFLLGASPIHSVNFPPASGDLTVTHQGMIPIGSHVVTVTASDGQKTASCTTNIVVNRMPQAIDFTTPAEMSFGTPLPLTASSSSGLPATVTVVSGPGVFNGATLTATGVGTIELRASQDGDATYAPATSVLAMILVRDTTPPVIAPHAPEVREATSAAGATVLYAPPAFDDDVTADGVATCVPASGSVFAFGDTPVTCTATDEAGNSASASFIVTVQDTTGPTIAQPGNVSVPATSPLGAAVTFDLPATTDAFGGAGTAACLPASGATFALGSTTVTCTASDANGNPAAPVTFTVTVTNTAPTVTVPADIVAEATGAAGASISFSVSGNDAEDGPLSASCSPAQGTFAIGTVAVSCSVVDKAGSSTTASFNVTVRDTTPPSIAAHGNLTPAATSAAGAMVTYTSPATTDIVDGAGFATCAPASGSQFGMGTTVVTCNATDARGNAAAPTTFTVTITNTAPTISVPANITKPATSASGAAVTFAVTGNDVENGSLTATCSKASGSVFPIGVTTVSCTVKDSANVAATGSFTVTVTEVTTPGEMAGDGFVRDDDAKYFFSFRARENASGHERAQISIRVDEDGWKWFKKHGRDRDRHNRDDRFVSKTVDFIAFSDDPTIRPGRNRKPQIDTVTFSGVGEWNGKRGYRYEAWAQDAGEPGRHRESIRVTIYSPTGQVVARFEGDLDGGNIRSSRIRH